MSICLDNPSALAREKAEQQNRFRLIVLSLIIILIAITGIGSILLLKDFDAGIRNLLVPLQNPTANTLNTDYPETMLTKYQVELYSHMQEEKKAFREFFLDLCQMVLLNLMLPILMAILALKIRGSADG